MLQSPRFVSILALLTALSVGSTAQGALLVIDDFELPGPAMVTLMTPADAPTVAQQNAPGVIGGQRDIRMAVDAGVGGASVFVVGNDLGKGYLDANTVAQRTASIHLQYDGIDVETGPNLTDSLGLFVDLTDGGKNNELLIRFANSQVPGNGLLNLYVEVVSSGGVSTYSGTKANNLLGGGGVPLMEDHFISLADFTGGADFTQVQSLTFKFNDDGNGVGSVGADFEVDMIATVPEPGSALLLGLGAMGWLGYCRRKRNRSAG